MLKGLFKDKPSIVCVLSNFPKTSLVNFSVLTIVFPMKTAYDAVLFECFILFYPSSMTLNSLKTNFDDSNKESLSYPTHTLIVLYLTNSQN